MNKKGKILLALLCVAPVLALAQTPTPTGTTSTTAGAVTVTMPLQVLAPAGCAVAFSSAGTVPVITVSGCAVPSPAPTPTPVPTPLPTPVVTFAAGASVVTTQQVNVWTAVVSGKGVSALAGTQPTGAIATIQSGPVNSFGTIFWNLTFTGGVSGWVGQDQLSVSGTTPTPAPTPTPTPTPTPAPTPSPTPNKALAAFPGAQGGGASSLGGRGGAVIEVTNLNDSGTGSLRACLEASGPRTCVFRVSGLITFLSRAQISNPYITIAGQTAPGGGIVIGGPNQQGEQIFVSTHDVVIRYLTYDGNNPNTPTGPDTGTVCCEMASADIYNVVWDHISARWIGNKAFPLISNVPGKGIHNMDIQWSLLYEPNVAHAVGIGTVYVSTGSGMATTDDDAHHNMFVTVDHRLPLNQSGRNVRWVNNLVYNWGMFAALSMGGVQTDYIGNKYVDGTSISLAGQGGALNYTNSHVFLANGNGCDPKDPAGDCPNGDNQTGPTLYLLNNTGRTGATVGSAMVTPTNVVNDAGQKSMTAQGWEAGDSGNPNSSGPMPASWFRSTPLPAEPFPIVADDVSNLDNVLLPTVGNSQQLNCDGTWVSNRDAQDTRIIRVYQNKLADDLFHGQFSAPAIPAGTPCVESLHDGIPDQWKTAKGLSTKDPNIYKSTAPNGYTWLENYLNGQ